MGTNGDEWGRMGAGERERDPRASQAKAATTLWGNTCPQREEARPDFTLWPRPKYRSLQQERVTERTSKTHQAENMRGGRESWGPGAPRALAGRDGDPGFPKRATSPAWKRMTKKCGDGRKSKNTKQASEKFLGDGAWRWGSGPTRKEPERGRAEPGGRGRRSAFASSSPGAPRTPSPTGVRTSKPRPGQELRHPERARQSVPGGPLPE